MLRIDIKPDGMNFLPLANFFPKTIRSRTRQMSATIAGTIANAVKVSGIANATDAIRDALLPALMKPIKPPATNIAM